VTPEAALAATATLVALAFSASTFERWLQRRRPHEAAWSLSLLLFAVASFALWLGVAKGWDAATFRVFFLFGAIVNVPWLAVGTVYLLGGPARGRPAAAVTAALSLYAAGVVTVAPLRGGVPATGLPKGSELFGALPRVLAAVASGGGATVVIAGAVWSAVRLARGAPGGRSGRLVVGNVLIAVGTLVLGGSGTLAGRLGEVRAFAVTLVIGIAVLFAGFLVATLPLSLQRPAQQLPAEAAR